MKEFKELLKQVKIATEAASMDPGSDPRTYTTKIGKIRRAKEDLKDLFAEYRNEVRKRVVFILPKGEGSESFTKIATEDLGCFQIDAEAPYKETIKNINPALFNKSPFDPALLNTISNYFQDVADEMGLLSYPQPSYKNKYAKTLHSQEDLLESVKEVLIEDVGAEIVGHYAVNKIALEAVKESFSGKIVPIILSTKDEKLLEKLEQDLNRITVRIFSIEANKEMTEEEVTKELTKIKKSISTK